MRAIIDLERLGYKFSLEAGRIRYVRGKGAPQVGSVFEKALLAKVTGQRAEAVEFLKQRQAGRVPEGLSAQALLPAPDDPEALWASVFGGEHDPGGAKAGQALEAELSALIDRWKSDANPQHHAGHARRYAELAIKLGLPYYSDDLSNDLGADGWRKWAEGVQ